MGSCISTSQSSATMSEHRQLWQDRQIRWDQTKTTLVPRLGETIIKKFENIEDTKGENGLGSLSISNLRLIWVANHNPKLNISIGLGNIAYIHYNMTESPTFGRVRAPHMMTQLSQLRFEFTFASRTDIAMILFNELDTTLRRYRATRMFRDLVLRDEHLVENERPVIYYGETLQKELLDCENLTTDEKFPGIMFITDRRVVWNSTRTPNINVSVPYIQFKAVGTRTSNCSTALVIETTQMTGGYVLGFKFSNTAKLSEAQSLLLSNFGQCKVNPYFGPLDGQVQYLDDRLVVVQEGQPLSPVTSASSAASPQRASTSSHVSQCQPRANQSPASARANTNQSGNLRNSSHSPFRDQSVGSGCSLTLLSDSSSPEMRSSENSESFKNLIHDQISLKEPLNLHHVDPLPIGLQAGQASVAYSAASQAANDQAELLLSISPSSRKYHAPRCVVCMATGTEAAFDPCGHLCSCMKCAAKLKHCPVGC